ncbi:MscS Mechanosensitive ion channel [Candidatus Promineifilum breve]|uniref:MscS Mechanosensitive ion channel n=1 Tax=Candidatus Promineifilum breve TaxID=1806508 RepID=A0A160T5L4_9CHLR|nr:MscS Mechanosensitive ion channel [Candidatus Promineifilum breve]
MHPHPHTGRRRGWPLLVTLLLLIWSSPVAASAVYQVEPTATPAATPPAQEGAPVIVNGQELFRLKTRVGSITATERAALVSDHISQLANNPFSGEIIVTVRDVEGATDIMVGEKVLVSVSDADAAAEGRARQELAQEWAAIIQTAIAAGQAGVSAPALGARLGIALLVLLGLLSLLWLINRFGDWLVDKLDPTTESGRLPPTLSHSEFYQSGQFSRLVRGLLRFGKIALSIFLITVAIPVILRSFPRTRPLGQSLIQLILNPLARLWNLITAALPEVAFLLVLAAVTWLITRLVNLLFREVSRGVVRLPSFEPDWAIFTGKMVNIFLIVVAVIVGFTSLPLSNLPVFQGIGAFLALLFTLASSSAIANIIAGIILTYTGAFRLGDYVQIQNSIGEVVGKYLLTTRVRTFKNEVVSFPNALVLGTSVTNFSRMAAEKGVVLHTTITIGYDVAWQRIHELLIAAALDTAHIEKTPPPFVLQTALNDFHVSYELNVHTRQPQYLPLIYSDLHRNIQDHFAAAGVEIMSPAYAALRDGNAITIPQVTSEAETADH